LLCTVQSKSEELVIRIETPALKLISGADAMYANGNPNVHWSLMPFNCVNCAKQSLQNL